MQSEVKGAPCWWLSFCHLQGLEGDENGQELPWAELPFCMASI